MRNESGLQPDLAAEGITFGALRATAAIDEVQSHRLGIRRPRVAEQQLDAFVLDDSLFACGLALHPLGMAMDARGSNAERSGLWGHAVS